MDFKQESEGNITALRSVYEKDRPRALLDIAIEHFGLAQGSIVVPGGVTVPASKFCIALNYHMEMFVPLTDIPQDKAERKKTMWANIEDPKVSYQVAALLLTLARMNYSSTWSFGSELRSTLDKLNFRVTKPEWIALMAQSRTYMESPFNSNSEKLFWMNPIAIALYAAEFAAGCGTLHNKLFSEKEIPADVLQMFNGAVKQNPKELLEAMVQTFVPAYFKEQEKDVQIAGFMNYLLSNGFFVSPATANAHDNYEGGLLIHTVDVLYKLANLVRPQTAAEMGQVVLLALCHDLSEVGVYKKSYRSEPVDGPAYMIKDNQQVVDQKRTLKWPDQRTYHMETKVVWTREDPLPIGAGPKSLHIALWYFRGGSLSEEMQAAISDHHRAWPSNLCCDSLMVENDLCRCLHLADFLASMLGRKVA